MPLATAYFRPETVEEASNLLGESNRVALAGGTVVNADRTHSGIEVVDLQSLGLGGIDAGGGSAAGAGRVSIGAMATLAAVADSEVIPDAVRTIARAELPSTLRSRATIGGTVASFDADSVLVAALLVHDAEVSFADGSTQPLQDMLANGLDVGALITAVDFDPTGTTATASTARTPADVPIVAAVARSSAAGTTLALTGVADTVVLANPEDPAAGLQPPGDFRGSSPYRRSLATTLAERALKEIQ